MEVFPPPPISVTSVITLVLVLAIRWRIVGGNPLHDFFSRARCTTTYISLTCQREAWWWKSIKPIFSQVTSHTKLLLTTFVFVIPHIREEILHETCFTKHGAQWGATNTSVICGASKRLLVGESVCSYAKTKRSIIIFEDPLPDPMQWIHRGHCTLLEIQ